MSLETQQLAWLVLQTVDRLQGKGSTVRLVTPSDQEVTRQLDPTLAEHELLAAEEYLLERGHITPANLGLTWGTYTITTTGLDWLDEGFPWPSEALQTAAEEPERARSGPVPEARRRAHSGDGGSLEVRDPEADTRSLRSPSAKLLRWCRALRTGDRSAGGAGSAVHRHGSLRVDDSMKSAESRSWWRRVLGG
jgi:hypothetical protein